MRQRGKNIVEADKPQVTICGACALHAGYIRLRIHTQIMWYCSSTTTMGARTRLHVTFYVHCVSCCICSEGTSRSLSMYSNKEHVWQIVYIYSRPPPLPLFEYLCLYESLAEWVNFISSCQAAAFRRSVSKMFTAAFTSVCFSCTSMKAFRLKWSCFFRSPDEF